MLSIQKSQVISKFTLSGEVIESEKSPGSGALFLCLFFAVLPQQSQQFLQRRGEGLLLVEGAEVLAEKPGAGDLQRQKGPCLQFPPGQGGGEDEHSQPRPGRLDQGGGADAFQKGLG